MNSEDIAYHFDQLQSNEDAVLEALNVAVEVILNNEKHAAYFMEHYFEDATIGAYLRSLIDAELMQTATENAVERARNAAMDREDNRNIDIDEYIKRQKEEE